MSTSSSGQFVWHELMTTHPRAAIQFYTDVIGWTVQPFGEGGEDGYNMWVNSDGALGGVAALPEEALKMGARPHWTCNVTVSDLDASVAKTTELDGKVLTPPTEIPGIGRFAVISDPQGAVLALIQPNEELKRGDVTRPGAFCWAELVTEDADAALPFYQALLGWDKLMSMDMGPMGMYTIFGQGDIQYGGVMNKPKEMPFPSAWLYYTFVADLDGSIARAIKHGSQLLHGPAPIPGGSRIAQLMDPQGAMFAVLGA